jgi:vacuolar-type H+-ATPase subunit F/Vma7
MSVTGTPSVAVVGRAEQIVQYRALGIATHAVRTPSEARDMVADLSKRGFRLIYVIEDLVAGLEDLLDEYATSTFPTIIPIPSSAGPTGRAMERLRETIKKAAGTDIFVGEEGGEGSS